jgi:TRAP-type C4-dicarboxylate transport system permease small subunit
VTDTAASESGTLAEIGTAMPPPDPAWLAPLARTSSALNHAAALVAAAILAGMTTYVLVEIGLRAFSYSTFMLDTLVGHGVAAVTMLAMPWTLEKGAMIRVGFFLKTGSDRRRWWLEIWSTLAALAFLCFLAKYQWATVYKDFVRGTTSQHYIPILNWIPGSIFLSGLLLTILWLVVRLLRQLAVGTPADTAADDQLD